MEACRELHQRAQVAVVGRFHRDETFFVSPVRLICIRIVSASGSHRKSPRDAFCVLHSISLKSLRITPGCPLGLVWSRLRLCGTGVVTGECYGQPLARAMMCPTALRKKGCGAAYAGPVEEPLEILEATAPPEVGDEHLLIQRVDAVNVGITATVATARTAAGKVPLAVAQRNILQSRA